MIFRRGFLLLPALLICIQVHAAPGFRQLALTDPQGKAWTWRYGIQRLQKERRKMSAPIPRSKGRRYS